MLVTHNIPLKSIQSKGKVHMDLLEDGLHVTLTERLATDFRNKDMDIKSYIHTDNNYRLPLQIDLCLAIDSPGAYLLFGKGHISFGTVWSDNRRIDDIVKPTYKPRFFHNHIPIGEFVNISIVYDINAMQIIINGEERYYSENERYMITNSLRAFNETGSDIRIACDKHTTIVLKSLAITEYDGAIGAVQINETLPSPIIKNEAYKVGDKPKFNSCLSLLPENIRNKIIDIDNFLLGLKPMKFSRKIDKLGNKITYIDCKHGFSYSMYLSNDMMYHSLSWYIMTNCKPEDWCRKDDMMESTLAEIDEINHELAKRLFSNLRECIACCLERCKVKTLYEYQGKKKLTCHGIMEFRMKEQDFDDVKYFIDTINKVYRDKE